MTRLWDKGEPLDDLVRRQSSDQGIDGNAGDGMPPVRGYVAQRQQGKGTFFKSYMRNC